MLGFAIVGAAALAAAVLAVLAYMIVLPRQPMRAPPPPLTSEQAALSSILAEHVHAIASRPHNLDHYPALEAAACYIEQQLAAMGHHVLLHEYLVAGRPVRNIEVVIEAAAAHAATATLVIGAHYDSPDDSPGANDNGSGVAALIEMARALRRDPSQVLRLRIVFFVNEEQPWGKTEAMGSLRHARDLRASGERVAGMIALETLGHFSEAEGSQRFPVPFGLIYSKRGNFIAFVGLLRARRLLHRCVRAFRSSTSFPCIGGIAPSFVEGFDLSDHWAYDKCGFPALMVTDTAPFRNPHYHTRGDLPGTVDYDSLARVTDGLCAMVRTLDV